MDQLEKEQAMIEYQLAGVRANEADPPVKVSVMEPTLAAPHLGSNDDDVEPLPDIPLLLAKELPLSAPKKRKSRLSRGRKSGERNISASRDKLNNTVRDIKTGKFTVKAGEQTVTYLDDEF